MFGNPDETFFLMFDILRQTCKKTFGFLVFFFVSENVRKVVSETYMLLKSKLTSTLQSMSLFLANKDTEYILFKPVKVRLGSDVAFHMCRIQYLIGSTQICKFDI